MCVRWVPLLCMLWVGIVRECVSLGGSVCVSACGEAKEHQSPLSSQSQATENLHLIVNVVKIITQKTSLALKLCALDLVPECGTSFY